MTVADPPADGAAPAQSTPPASSSSQPLAARAVGSTAWTMTSQVFQVVLGLVAFGVLSRWLTPVDYGRLGLAGTVTSFVGIVGDAGIGWALVRLPKIDATAEATGFWLSMMGAGILTLISAIAAPIIAWFYKDSALAPLALGMSTTFLLAAPGRVSGAKLTRQFRFRAVTLTGIAVNLVATTLAVVLAARGFGTWALVGQMLATVVINAVVITLLAPPLLRQGRFSRERAKELGGFAWQLSGYNIAVTIQRSLDMVLGGRFLGSAAVGLMSMGQRLAFFPVERLSAATYAVFLPTIVEIGEGPRQARAFQAAMRLLVMLIAPFCFGTIAIAPELVSWLNPRWSGLAPVLCAFAVGSLFAPFNQLCSSVLVAHGRAAFLFRMAIALIPVTWAGAVVGALSGSVVVLVGAWGFGLAATAVILLRQVWRRLGLTTEFFAQIATPLGGGLIMAVAVRLALRLAGLGGQRAGLVLGALVGMAVYAAFAWLLMRADVVRTLELLKRSRSRGKAAPAS